MAVNLAEALRLMLVTDDRVLAGRDPIEACRAAVRGGVTMVQLRLKESNARELAALARALCQAVDVPVIINDRADVALAAGAAGVHLGPDDLAPALVRRLAPAGFVIGASVGSDVEIPRGSDADYWGIGPWRSTGTKADAGAALGAQRLGELVKVAGARPAVAIGGVRPDDVPVLLKAGVTGVAVVSGILGASDIESAARAYAQALACG
ncbi:MAG TPA: thiamine phosphate synthase [Gemmatimonadales bacterium]|nr:thiamine phosphate synthase [Gemmatimonadales bacterium]